MFGTDEKPGSTIAVVDVPSGKELQTVELEGFTRPHGIRWLADDRHVWVTAEFETSLLRIDTRRAGSSSGSIPVRTARTCSRFRPTESISTPRTGAPTRSASSTASTGRKLRDLPAGPGAEGIDVSPDGSEIIGYGVDGLAYSGI